MLIRCERCSTVYAFDEKLLPLGGAPVQCTRCQHVFSAFPPQAAARIAIYPPPPASPTASTQAPVPAAGTPPSEARRAAPPRPEPKAEPPVSGPATRAPMARDPQSDTIAMFAAPVRSAARWKWLGPLLAAVVIAAGYATWTWHSRRIAPTAERMHAEGLALLARDDAASLARAAAIFTEALALDGKVFRARADRSLAMLLLAADARDDARMLEARFRELEAERLGLEQEKEAGWRLAQADLIEKMRAVKAELDRLQERAGRLGEEALGELRGMARQAAEDVSVNRALAMYFAMAGNEEQCAKLLKNGRASGQQDPWLDIAEALIALAAPDSGQRGQRASASLELVVASRPDLLRARMLLARSQADRGQVQAAVSTLDGLLAVNAEHEAASRLKADLLAPPAAKPIAQPPRLPPFPGRQGSGKSRRLPRRSAAAEIR